MALFAGRGVHAQDPSTAQKKSSTSKSKSASHKSAATAKSTTAKKPQSTTATTSSTTAHRRGSTSKTTSKSSKTTAKTTKRTPPQRVVKQQQPTQARYKEIQQALADKGYFSGPVDGSWGPESVDALKRFQREQNLTEDGKIGSLSLIALGLGPKRTIDAAPEKQVQR